MKDETRKLILDWMRKVHILEYANRFESIMWKNVNLTLGIPALVLGFAITISSKVSFFENLKDIIVPAAAALITVLTGLQTFLKASEKAESHRKLSAKYEELRHRIELLLEFESDDSIKNALEKIRKDWANIDSLNVSDSHFDEAKNKVTAFKKYPKELGFLETINDK